MIVRIYLREAEHGRRKTLMQEILNLLHDRNPVQSVIVCRGIAGMGDDGEVHAADLLRLNVDLPLVVEFFARTTRPAHRFSRSRQTATPPVAAKARADRT